MSNAIISNSQHRSFNGGLDKYYTPYNVAKSFCEKIIGLVGEYPLFIEPSAGSGVFIDALKSVNQKAEVLAYDLSPDHDCIQQQDFLKFSAEIFSSEFSSENIVVFGNPPFGFKASLAIKFFNKAAEFANKIAFIVPASFVKQSVKNKLNTSFKLVFEQKENIFFELPGEGTKEVPCVLQIWEKSAQIREVVKHYNKYNLDCCFVSNQSEANVIIRRVGAKAGRLLSNETVYSKSSTYFLKCSDDIKKIISSVDFTKNVNNTAGVRSLSKSEFWETINNCVNQ